MVFVSKEDFGGRKSRWLVIVVIVAAMLVVVSAVWAWSAKPWEDQTVLDAVGPSYTETNKTFAGKLKSRDTGKKTITLIDVKTQSPKTYRYDNSTGYFKGMNYDKIKLGDIATDTYIQVTYNTETARLVRVWVEQ